MFDNIEVHDRGHYVMGFLRIYEDDLLVTYVYEFGGRHQIKNDGFSNIRTRTLDEVISDNEHKMF